LPDAAQPLKLGGVDEPEEAAPRRPLEAERDDVVNPDRE
jgi:hypothetical protein